MANQCSLQGGLCYSSKWYFTQSAPRPRSNGKALIPFGRKLKQREAVLLAQGCTRRGSFCAPVPCRAQLGPLVPTINRQRSRCQGFLRSEKIHHSERMHLPGLEAAPCTLTPNTVLTLPDTPSVPWNLSRAGAQTAAPLASPGKEAVPGGELA